MCIATCDDDDQQRQTIMDYLQDENISGLDINRKLEQQKNSRSC